MHDRGLGQPHRQFGIALGGGVLGLGEQAIHRHRGLDHGFGRFGLGRCRFGGNRLARRGLDRSRNQQSQQQGNRAEGHMPNIGYLGARTHASFTAKACCIKAIGSGAGRAGAEILGQARRVLFAPGLT